MPTYRFESRITGDHEHEPTVAELEMTDRNEAISEARRSLVGLCADMLQKKGSGIDIAVREEDTVLFEARISLSERVRA